LVKGSSHVCFCEFVCELPVETIELSIQLKDLFVVGFKPLIVDCYSEFPELFLQGDPESKSKRIPMVQMFPPQGLGQLDITYEDNYFLSQLNFSAKKV